MYALDLNGNAHDLRAIGRRVEERRGALCISIDDLCTALGLSGSGSYWRKVTCKKDDRFTMEELTKAAAFLAAPEGWPFRYKPDPERIKAFALARTAAMEAKRATENEVKRAARRLVPQVPACSHEQPISWCGPCVADALVKTELDALRRCLQTLEALYRKQEEEARAASGENPLPKARAKQAKASLEAIRGIYEGAAARHGVAVASEDANVAPDAPSGSPSSK